MTNYSVVYQEMGQKIEADNQIEFVCGYNGKYFLHTDLELKGRGIKKTGNGEDHARGLKSYYATEKAMGKLKNQYKCTYTANL